MVVRIYVPTTALPRRRIVVFTVLLFACVSVLAASMARQRGVDPLGPRFRPKGWRISLRTPKGWTLGPSIPSVMVTVLPFHRRAKGGISANLAVWEYAKQLTTNERQFCAFVMHRYDPTRPEPGAETRWVGEVRTLGARQGVELINPDGSAVVRAVTLEGGPGYAVSLSAGDTPIDEALYRLFELTCQSVRYIGS